MTVDKESLPAGIETKTISKCEELVTIWKLKCTFGLLLGLVFGIIPIRGIGGFMMFFLCQYLITQYYCKKREIPDYFMDTTDVFIEHLLPSLGIFVVSVIAVFVKLF
ncbi:ER membrane protein complex subunit 6-like [Babesia duncani]|uniref:ER membrane protein complex subunit 6-like n=1 Tax=Babesia duncani TaxID=323732 RepID=A0AAD9PKG6_9APIC|nr:ER membrane protein complex subunit 6-like [Babesia duncani]